MIKYLLLFLLPLSLFATKILSYNIYDRTDRVDLMITFDRPYTGVIKQSRSGSKIVVKLENSEIETEKVKKLSTKFLKSITITPMEDFTQISAVIPKDVYLIAAKTTDAYGLRLRFSHKQSEQRKAQEIKKTFQNQQNHLPTKKDDTLSSSYYLVVTILLIGIAILFFLQRKIKKNTLDKQKDSWLYNDTKQENTKQTTKMQNGNAVAIRFQKNIDDKNSVVMIDFAEQSYLVLMGENNLLLDKFVDDKPTTQEDFETILKSRHQELDDFLKVENRESKEALQTYKERAASIRYSEEN